MAQPSSQLVGRAAELAVVEGALAELERRSFVGLELAGEPGIGKTRLLAELELRADRRGQIVLSGSASELERELPFWIFIDALDDYLHALEPRRLGAIDGDARASSRACSLRWRRLWPTARSLSISACEHIARSGIYSRRWPRRDRSCCC